VFSSSLLKKYGEVKYVRRCASVVAVHLLGVPADIFSDRLLASLREVYGLYGDLALDHAPGHGFFLLHVSHTQSPFNCCRQGGWLSVQKESIWITKR
jgi:hypothetical protein